MLKRYRTKLDFKLIFSLTCWVPGFGFTDLYNEKKSEISSIPVQCHFGFLKGCVISNSDLVGNYGTIR